MELSSPSLLHANQQRFFTTSQCLVWGDGEVTGFRGPQSFSSKERQEIDAVLAVGSI